MVRLNDFSQLSSATIAAAAAQYGTPLYLYDEGQITANCQALLAMPSAYGLTVRYAMKACSTAAILKLISKNGLKIDASSLNEAIRAEMAGIPAANIMLTTQEVPTGERLEILKRMMAEGLKYNVCSLLQLKNIADFAAEHKINLSMRVHPGVGAGESATRNTGDNYSCFGVHLSNIEEALAYAGDKGVVFDKMHVHIGSGGDPEKWRENIDRELELLEKYFPDATTVAFGGGLKVARLPGETAADIEDLGNYAKERIAAFAAKTGRELKMEIEPGTYVVADAGYILTTVIDKKRTGDDGLNFLVLDGGMEVNIRPLLYGAQHPFYVVAKDGRLLSSEFGELPDYAAAVVGRCCESGDSQSMDDEGRSTPRRLAEPAVGDTLVIGGAGAYCSAMAPFNYNSHVQAPEALFTKNGELKLIRKRQSLAQVVENELDV